MVSCCHGAVSSAWDRRVFDGFEFYFLLLPYEIGAEFNYGGREKSWAENRSLTSVTQLPLKIWSSPTFMAWVLNLYRKK